MKAYVTSIGEPTTELCAWSLERQGLEVVLLDDPKTTLAQKLKQIYLMADDDFIRVDADVIINRYISDLIASYVGNSDIWWAQGQVFGWFAQAEIYGGVHFIKAPAISILRKHINNALRRERPETEMFRLPELHNPRRCVSYTEHLVGLHGYRQNDLQRIMATKKRRGQMQNYDFELAMKIEDLP